MNWSPWKTVTLVYLTDDDLTPSVDLEGDYEYLTLLIPAITSSTVTIHASRDNSTFFPVYMFDTDATGAYAQATTAAETSLSIIYRIGGCRWVKVSTGSAQGADRSFLLKGFNK